VGASVEIEGVDNLAKMIDGMIKNIDTLGNEQLGTELTAWQTDDMHRQYPNTQTEPNAASTEIWPRSRTPKRYVRKTAQRRRRGTVMLKRGKGRGRQVSTRPILRVELFDKLCTRMAALLEKSLSWASASPP
jgi:hypothetical protein